MATDLSAFLDLRPSDAADQWERILARTTKARQDDYLPVEVLFCFGLSAFGVVDAHRYGRSNIDKAPAALHVLAQTLKRPPRSLTYKILNLEGFQSNGGKGETELYKALCESPERFVRAYGAALSGARRAGLGPDQVPDLSLGLEGAPDPELEPLVSVPDPAPEPGPTTRPRLVATRVGQQLFRRKVMLRWDQRCGVTGVDRPFFLRASHILPWSKSSDVQRLDPDNGLPLVVGYDVAFDGRYISFDDDGRLVPHPELSPTLAEHLGINLKARLSQRPRPAMQAYLALHRELPIKGMCAPAYNTA